MTDAARPSDPESEATESHEEPGTGGLSEEEEEPELIGTLFVVMVFIIMTAGMWSAVYFMLLGR
ncbi:MAG: hypothetical protein R3326_05335 [Gemmatimonadota bacterium]|nr:hypothetical protein [Gemmatimonadota bacterium]